MEIPKIVAIETQSVCNGLCTICPYGKIKIEHGIMPIQTVKNILDECEQAGIKEVSLFGNNEPLIDKRIIDILEYAGQKNLHINIDSNMGFMTREIANAIIKNTDTFNISFHCNTLSDHQKYMPGVNHETIMKNIGLFYDIYKNTENPRAKIFVYNMVCNSIINKLKFKRFWKKYNFKVNFGKYNSRASNLFDVPDKEVNTCTYGDMPNNYMHIAWNGDVLLCCNDWKRKFVMGNIKDGLINVWNNESFKINRRIINNEQKAPEGHLCRKCEFGRK